MIKATRGTLAFLVVLASCGGGGSSTSIAVSTTAVRFDAEAGGPLPAAQTVHATFQGDGLVVGYPTGVSEPSWLAVSEVGHTATTVDISLRVTNADQPGTRTTTLRFATGKADGSQIKFADVQVAYGVSGISVSTAAVRFDAEAGGSLPAAQTVRATFQGDDVVVGFPVGIGVPSWLSLSEVGRTATTIDVSLRVTNADLPETRTTTVRFATRNADGSRIKFADVSVTYVVITPFRATAPAMTFSAMGGSSQAPEPGAGYTVAIQGDLARWRASGSEPWLKLSTASGTGPATVFVTADAAGVTAGRHEASVVVVDDASGRRASLPATLTVRAPKLTTTATSRFTVDVGAAPAALAEQITLSDEIGGASPEWAVSWSVKSVGVDWLHLSPTSGRTSPPSTVTLTVDAAKLLGLDNGSHDATVVLSYDNADAAGQTLTVPISMDLCLPRADRIAPYLGTADRGGRFYLRGSGFACPGPKLVARLGTAELAKTVDSDTQGQADYAGLTAGRYPVRFDNQLGLELGSAELVVLAPPGLAYQPISAPSRRERLLYDAERQTLYAVNQTDQSIERYARSGGTWSALRPIVVPDLKDVDLSPDGRLLLVASMGSLSDIDLTADTPSLVERAKNPDSFCGQHFAQMAVPNSGKVFLVTKLSSCSGFSDTYLYDLRSHAVTRAPTIGLFNGIAAASADGSRIFMGSNGLSPAPEVSIFDALNNSIVRGPVDFNLFAVSVSGDAARVILQGTEVYSRALSLTGRLPAGGGAVASRDSSRAYVYRDDGDAGPRLEVFDLNGDLTAGALYPLLKTVRLADSPNTAAGRSVQMVPTPDDSAAFVSGNSRVLVVPVN